MGQLQSIEVLLPRSLVYVFEDKAVAEVRRMTWLRFVRSMFSLAVKPLSTYGAQEMVQELDRVVRRTARQLC